MSAPVRIWLETSHHAAFQVGGWAWVRREADGAVSGSAGGERRMDAEGVGPAALKAALAGLPSGAAVEIRSASAPVLTLSTPERPVRPAKAAAGTPNAFAAAWAELARDRAKDRGNFTAPIPKPNLAKAGVPA